MSKFELTRMTWREAEDKFKENPVILIPMGSIEQHGPTTPVGDYRYMTEICREVAKRTGAISVPTIPWGYSEVFKNFPGTITIRPDTLKALLIDHIESLVKFGLDHIMFVCGHKGNLPILEQLAREIKDRYKLRVATIEPIGWFDDAWKKEVYGTSDVHIGHGSDPMLSLAMELFPEDVREDLYEEGHKSEWNGHQTQGVANFYSNDDIWYMYLDYDDIAPNGVIGDAKHASAEVGKRTVERMINISSRIVKDFAKIDTRIS